MHRVFSGLLLFLIMSGVVLIGWHLGYLPDFETIRASRDHFSAYAMSMPVRATLLFSLIYIGVVAFSIPLATPLSLLAGFLFGSVLGTLLVVVSATLGASCIFLLARYFFRDYFEAKVGTYRERLVTETQLNGFRDVLIVRLVPFVPFSLINILAGLTRVSLSSYMLATLIGIVPFSFVYVHAGVALGEITSLRDIASSEGMMFVTRIALVLVLIYLIRRFYSR